MDALKTIPLALITQPVHDAKEGDDTTDLGPSLPSMKNLNVKIFSDTSISSHWINLEWIDNMISGQCLYYDVYGNLNMISVLLFEDIDMLLKPMKATVSSKLENKYAS